MTLDQASPIWRSCRGWAARRPRAFMPPSMGKIHRSRTRLIRREVHRAVAMSSGGRSGETLLQPRLHHLGVVAPHLLMRSTITYRQMRLKPHAVGG